MSSEGRKILHIYNVPTLQTCKQRGRYKYGGKSKQTPTVKKIIMSTVCVCGGGWRRKSQN